MGNGSGVSRGDRNRNARLERLRALVSVRTRWPGSIWREEADGGGHRSRLEGDRAADVQVPGWDVGSALDLAAGRAVAAGWLG